TALLVTRLARGRAFGGSCGRVSGGSSRCVLLRLAEIAAAMMATVLALLALGGLAIGGSAILALALAMVAMTAAALVPRPPLFRATAGAPDFGRRCFGACRLDGGFGDRCSLGSGRSFRRCFSGRLSGGFHGRRFGFGSGFR